MTIHSPAPRRDGTRTALIAGIALSALLLVGVGVLALVLALGGGDGDDDGDDPGPGGTGGPADGQTPEEAMRAFVEATNETDCELLVDHPITETDSVQDCEDTIEKAREDAEAQGFDFESFTLSIDDLEVAAESDTEATVVVDITQGFEVDGEADEYSDVYEYELEKDGDRWLVVDVDIEIDLEDPVGPDGA